MTKRIGLGILIFMICLAVWFVGTDWRPYKEADPWYTDDGSKFANFVDKVSDPRVFIVPESKLKTAIEMLECAPFVLLSRDQAANLLDGLEPGVMVEQESKNLKDALAYSKQHSKGQDSTKEQWEQQLQRNEKIDPEKLQPYLVRGVDLGGDRSNIGLYFNGHDLTVVDHCYGPGKFKMNKMPVIVFLDHKPEKIRMWVWNILG